MIYNVILDVDFLLSRPPLKEDMKNKVWAERILILKFYDACVVVIKKMYLHKNAISQKDSISELQLGKILANAPSACGGVVKI